MHPPNLSTNNYHHRPDYEVENDCYDEDGEDGPPPRENGDALIVIQGLPRTIESLRTQMESYADRWNRAMEQVVDLQGRNNNLEIELLRLRNAPPVHFNRWDSIHFRMLHVFIATHAIPKSVLWLSI